MIKKVSKCHTEGFCQQNMAIIMTVYQDFDFVINNIRKLHEGFDVFIHIDKKANVPNWFLNEAIQLKNVWIDSLYRINWGGIQHIKAVLRLIEKAYMTNKAYKRYIIMSENESSIYTVNSIKSFFMNNQDKNYIEISKRGEKGNTNNRIVYYYFMHMYNTRSVSILGRINTRLWTLFEKMLKKLNITHKLKNNYPFKGYMYCALEKKAVSFICSNKSRIKEMLREIKFFYVGEEYLFQNIFIDSSIQETIENNSLIFDDWSTPQLGLPRYIRSSDINNLRESGSLLFRKIGSKDEDYTKMKKNLFIFEYK